MVQGGALTSHRLATCNRGGEREDPPSSRPPFEPLGTVVDSVVGGLIRAFAGDSFGRRVGRAIVGR